MVQDCSLSNWLTGKPNKHLHINIYLEAFLSSIENIENSPLAGFCKFYKVL